MFGFESQLIENAYLHAEVTVEITMSSLHVCFLLEWKVNPKSLAATLIKE